MTQTVEIIEFSTILNNLFRVHRHPSGREYRGGEVEQYLEKHYEISITGAYIRDLRSGRIKNPSRETLIALALFFEVPVTAFFPELASLRYNGIEAEDSTIELERAAQAYGIPSTLYPLFKGLADALVRTENHV